MRKKLRYDDIKSCTLLHGTGGDKGDTTTIKVLPNDSLDEPTYYLASEKFDFDHITIDSILPLIMKSYVAKKMKSIIMWRKGRALLSYNATIEDYKSCVGREDE